ncbi:MAG: NmrA family NAD(P)-binding protein [Sphingomonadales bacterium]
MASTLIFGAGGRLGGAVARHLRYLSPGTRLRLATSRAEAADALRRDYPGHEVILADFMDAASMRACFAGADSAFLVTPNFLDEERAMANVVAAAGPGLRQMIRIVGDPPGISLAKVPASLSGPGPATQHLLARQALDKGGAPVIYFNLAAALMDNLFANAPAVSRLDLLAQPERMHGFVDSGEVGEIAARILLSSDARHLGQTYDLNNGQDLLPWSGVAAMMSSVFLRDIRHDGSDAAFLEHLGPLYNRKMGFDGAAAYFLDYFRKEAKYDLAWRRTDFAETVLGRKPKTLRAWLEQHAASFAPQP